MSIFLTPISSAFGQHLIPSDGAKLFFFETGTTTPKASFTTAAEDVPLPDPVVANAAGRFPAIYISGLYKAVLKDKNDVQIWSEDDLVGRGGELDLKGEFDASTNGGDYPFAGQSGDMYKVTPGFTLNAQSGGHILQTGDHILANKAGATDIDADWDILRGVVSNVGTKALTDGANIATDCSEATVFTVTLAGNRTLDNPTNKIVGQTYTWVITQDGTGSRGLAFGSNFDFEGTNVISPGAGVVTRIVGTVISSSSIRCTIERLPVIASDFSTNNMIINVQSSTTVDLDADNIVFIDDFGGTKRVDNVDITFDIANRMAGTSAKISTWYQLYLDSNLVAIPVPDLEGTADANVLNSLSDSGATFVTDKAQVDDEIFQLDDQIKGFVKAISSETVITCKDKDGNDLDLFPLGTEAYKIRMLSPVGIGPIKARLGAAFRNSSGNFDDSTYTQIQEQKTYLGTLSGGGGDFIVSGGGITTINRCVATPYQTNDWTGLGTWFLDYKFDGSRGTNTNNIDIFFSGVSFKTGFSQPVSATAGASASASVTGFANGATNSINHDLLTATTTASSSGNPELNLKPTFAK